MAANSSAFRDRKPAVLTRRQFPRLIEIMREQGYEVIGPMVADGAVVYDTVESVDDLPMGWTEEQDGGRYRLKRRNDKALFGYTVGPHSWKQVLHPPAVRLLEAQRKPTDVVMSSTPPVSRRFAFLGARPCDLQAIAVLDKVFLRGAYVDPNYQACRQDLLVVAVNCGVAGGTCFCVSMGTGPRATQGFDLALTEVVDEQAHYFVVETGSDRGAALLKQLPHRRATKGELAHARRIVANTARHMGRTLETNGIKELLYGSYEHPRWKEVAARCLNCANCTMVCPTCFCSNIEDVTDLTGQHAERWRRWDSCFTLGFTYIVGGSVRASGLSRYRHWLIHKLATWWDQFGTSGCVGCGRCITWCPVAIDITEEVTAIRQNQQGISDENS